MSWTLKAKPKAKGLGADRRARKEAAKEARRGGAVIPPKRIPSFIDGHSMVMARLEKRLTKMEVRLVDRPRHKDGKPIEPRLPPDLTMLNDVRLGRLYGHFCQMVQYVQLQLALQTVKRALADRAEKYERARRWLLSSGTVGDKEASVEVETTVQERSIEALNAQAQEGMLDSLMQSYLIGKDTCSREITRRQNTTQRAGYDG